MYDRNLVVMKGTKCWTSKSMGWIWGIFTSSNDEGGNDLGQDENLRATKNTDFGQLKTLFDISESLILNHGREICGISTIEWHLTLWRISILLNDRALKL